MSALPWKPGGIRRPKPDRPDKVPLTQAQIVRAGLRIVQAEGIDAVSMRRLAAEFETGPSSLYAHVANKDELLQLMFDEMVGMVEIPELEPARWKEQVRELARAGHQVMVDHNDLARAALGTIPTGPNALRVSNAMLEMVLAGGIPPRFAAWALDRIFLYITADAYEHAIWRTEVTETGAVVADLSADLVAYFEQVPADLYPKVRKHAHDLVGGGTDARFEFGLEMLLDGLDKHATSPAHDSRGPAGQNAETPPPPLSDPIANRHPIAN